MADAEAMEVSATAQLASPINNNFFMRASPLVNSRYCDKV